MCLCLCYFMHFKISKLDGILIVRGTLLPLLDNIKTYFHYKLYLEQQNPIKNFFSVHFRTLSKPILYHPCPQYLKCTLSVTATVEKHTDVQYTNELSDKYNAGKLLKYSVFCGNIVDWIPVTVPRTRLSRVCGEKLMYDGYVLNLRGFLH